MKSLRKKIKESRERVHHRLTSWLRPKVGAIGIKYRIAARVRLANAWATKHPKYTFVIVTSTLLFLLVGSMAIDNLKDGNAKQPEPAMSQIANVDPVLNGFRAIQANKDQQRQSLLGIVERGQKVRHALDSLIALPVKTHADSLHIVMNYRQLEKIVQTIKNHNTDETQD